MVKLDVVALVTAIGGLATAFLNYFHGRDDSREVHDLKEGILEEAKHTARVTEMLNGSLESITGMLGSLISAIKPEREQ
jgi:hypothetical protein